MSKLLVVVLFLPLLVNQLVSDSFIVGTRASCRAEVYGVRSNNAPSLQGSIIITEIMSDPTPAVSLPAVEYVELYNNSPVTIEMTGWSFSHNSTSVSLPNITMAPGTYMIICGTTAAASLQQFGPVTGVKSFPSLLDAGAILVLRDSEGNMIHGVEYNEKWHSSGLKKDGGWSLEIVDINHPFYAEGNWRSSTSRSGGTPGYSNSVSAGNPDSSPVFISNIFPTDSLTLTITFNKSIASFSCLTEGYAPDLPAICDIAIADPLQRSFLLKLSTPLVRRKIYSYSSPGDLRDFSGNLASSGPIRFALAEPSLEGDLRFNELLFDPWPDEYDYVELVNVSDRCIDASRLLLVSENLSTGTVSSAYPLSTQPRCILPGTYFTVTADPETILKRYFSGDASNTFSVPALPSMPDDKASLSLFNRELDLIDMVTYDESYHFSLLSDPEGVALEKITPEADSGNRHNWHSASSAAGWGTPGAVNSVFTDVIPAGAGITLSGQRITPDSDGIDDVLVIDFNSPSAENVITIKIFDENGYLVRTLADNVYTGYEAVFRWDGTSDDGSLLPTGLYIVLVSSFDSSGHVSRWKKAVAILRR
jgi:hypothetical protein